MCLTCHPLKKYESVQTREQMDLMKAHAFTYVELGNVKVVSEFEDTNYKEISFFCEDCGTRHILWMHTNYLEHGGEWRTIPASA